MASDISQAMLTGETDQIWQDLVGSNTYGMQKRFIIDNLSNWYIFNGEVLMGLPILRKYENILRTNLVSYTLPNKTYYYRPEYVSYKLYGSTDYWYLLLFLNNMKSADEFTKDTINVFQESLIGTLNKIYIQEEQNISTRQNPRVINKNILKDLSTPSTRLIKDEGCNGLDWQALPNYQDKTSSLFDHEYTKYWYTLTKGKLVNKDGEYVDPFKLNAKGVFNVPSMYYEDGYWQRLTGKINLYKGKNYSFLNLYNGFGSLKLKNINHPEVQLTPVDNEEHQIDEPKLYFDMRKANQYNINPNLVKMFDTENPPQVITNTGISNDNWVFGGDPDTHVEKSAYAQHLFLDNGRTYMAVLSNFSAIGAHKEDFLYSPWFKVKKNTKYTVSFDWFCNNATLSMDLYALGDGGNPNAVFWSGQNAINIVAGDKGDHSHNHRVSYTFTTNNIDTRLYLRFDNNGVVQGTDGHSDIWIGNVKVEEGPYATPYTTIMDIKDLNPNTGNVLFKDYLGKYAIQDNDDHIIYDETIVDDKTYIISGNKFIDGDNKDEAPYSKKLIPNRDYDYAEHNKESNTNLYRDTRTFGSNLPISYSSNVTSSLSDDPDDTLFKDNTITLKDDGNKHYMSLTVPSGLTDSNYYTLSFLAKGNSNINLSPRIENELAPVVYKKNDYLTDKDYQEYSMTFRANSNLNNNGKLIIDINDDEFDSGNLATGTSDTWKEIEVTSKINFNNFGFSDMSVNDINPGDILVYGITLKNISLNKWDDSSETCFMIQAAGNNKSWDNSMGTRWDGFIDSFPKGTERTFQKFAIALNTVPSSFINNNTKFDLQLRFDGVKGKVAYKCFFVKKFNKKQDQNDLLSWSPSPENTTRSTSTNEKFTIKQITLKDSLLDPREDLTNDMTKDTFVGEFYQEWAPNYQDDYIFDSFNDPYFPEHYEYNISGRRTDLKRLNKIKYYGFNLEYSCDLLDNANIDAFSYVIDIEYTDNTHHIDKAFTYNSKDIYNTHGEHTFLKFACYNPNWKSKQIKSIGFYVTYTGDKNQVKSFEIYSYSINELPIPSVETDFTVPYDGWYRIELDYEYAYNGIQNINGVLMDRKVMFDKPDLAGILYVPQLNIKASKDSDTFTNEPIEYMSGDLKEHSEKIKLTNPVVIDQGLPYNQFTNIYSTDLNLPDQYVLVVRLSHLSKNTGGAVGFSFDYNHDNKNGYMIWVTTDTENLNNLPRYAKYDQWNITPTGVYEWDPINSLYYPFFDKDNELGFNLTTQDYHEIDGLVIKIIKKRNRLRLFVRRSNNKDDYDYYTPFYSILDAQDIPMNGGLSFLSVFAGLKCEILEYYPFEDASHTDED